MPSVPKHRKLLGEAVRAVRKKGGFTQEKLAEKSGLSTVFVSRVECGKESPTIDSLAKIAAALKVGVHELTRDF